MKLGEKFTFSADAVCSQQAIKSARTREELIGFLGWCAFLACSYLGFLLINPFVGWLVETLKTFSGGSFFAALATTIVIGMSIVALMAAAVMVGLFIAGKMNEKRIALQPLDAHDAEAVLDMAEDSLDIESYRLAVASTREFLKGDLQLMKTMKATAADQLAASKQEQALAETKAKLYATGESTASDVHA